MRRALRGRLSQLVARALVLLDPAKGDSCRHSSFSVSYLANYDWLGAYFYHGPWTHTRLVHKSKCSTAWPGVDLGSTIAGSNIAALARCCKLQNNLIGNTLQL